MRSDRPGLRDMDRPYEPRGAAREMLLRKDRAILIDGPAGTGKSIALLNKAFIQAEKYPGARILLVRKTRKSMTESVLVTWESKVVPEGHACLRGASRRVRQSYDFANGSTVVLGGMDSDHEAAVMSTDYDFIYVFEGTELTLEDFDKLLTRLRNGKAPYQQMVIDCNPAHDKHWLKVSADSGKLTRLISRHEDNPLLYDARAGEWTRFGREYVHDTLGRLEGVRRLRLLEGKWAAAEGVVYAAFDEAVHVIDGFDVPADWRRKRVIDFGYRNPFVCQWWAMDGDGRAYLYREVYGAGKIVEDWARIILDHSEGERYESTIADHDAEDRATLARYGITTIPANKSVKPGIEAVASRLSVQGDGKPRLYIMRDALVRRDVELDAAGKPCSTLEEFDCYVWPKGRDGKPEKEEPVKENDHGMDAMRYLVADLDDITSQQVEIRVIGGDDRRSVWASGSDNEDIWTRV